MQGTGGRVGGARDTSGPFAWVFCILVLLFVLPILATHVLPSMDGPNHVAIVHTLAAEGTEPGWHDHFENRLTAAPYSTYYALGVGLARIFSAAAAHRILLAAYAVLLPLAFAYLVTGLDPAQRWASLFGFLAVYSDSYFVGFANYLLSLPLLFFGAGLAVRLVRREQGGVGLALGLGAVAVLLFFTHPLAAVLLPVVLAVLVPPRVAHRGRLAWLGAALGPGLILLGAWMARAPAFGAPTHLPFDFRLAYLARTPFILASGAWLGCAVALTVALAANAFRTAWIAWRPRALSPLRSSLVGWVLLAVLYGVLPGGIGTTIWLSLRVALVVWLVGLALWGHLLVRDALGKGLVVALCLLQLAQTLSTHIAFAHDLAPLEKVVAQMEPSRQIVTITIDTASDVPAPFYRGDPRGMFAGGFTYHLHMGAYYHAEKGGRSPWMTFHSSLPYVPLGLRDPYLRERFHIAEPFFAGLLVQRLPELVQHFDYILIRTADPQLAAALAERLPQVTSSGPYHLYAPRP